MFLFWCGDSFCVNKRYFCRNLYITDCRHMHCQNTIEICSIYWNVLPWTFSNWTNYRKIWSRYLLFPPISVENFNTRWKFLYALKISKSVFFAGKEFRSGIIWSKAWAIGLNAPWLRYTDLKFYSYFIVALAT